jgi:hypothetical protein
LNFRTSIFIFSSSPILTEKSYLRQAASQLAGMQNSFQTQIDRMQMEIQAYDDLKAGKVEITMGSIAVAKRLP